MARRFFRKLVPSEHKLREQRILRVFGATLFNRRLWQLNRHSTAWGVASGLFWAWIMLPIQTIGAVTTAICGRGNVALAMAFTWVSNPLTMLPCFLLTYWVGLKVTGAKPIHGLQDQIRAAMDAGLVDGTIMAGKMLVHDMAQLYPAYVGGVIVGLVTGGIGYLFVKLAWRWSVARRWQHRHETRRRLNPAVRLTRGLAHLYRLRNEAGHTP